MQQPDKQDDPQPYLIPPHVPAPDVATAADLMLCLTDEDWEGLTLELQTR
jgi:hypothetical protein